MEKELITLIETRLSELQDAIDMQRHPVTSEQQRALDIAYGFKKLLTGF